VLPGSAQIRLKFRCVQNFTIQYYNSLHVLPGKGIRLSYVGEEGVKKHELLKGVETSNWGTKL